MKVGIVGAGIGGLAAAYDLVRAGCEVTVYEKADYVGGLSAGFKIPRWKWSVEHYYHHWFASDRYVLSLIKELGWSHNVVFPRPFTAVYHEGEFYPLDSPIAVLRFPGLSLFNRIRLGAVVAYLKFVARWEPLESITADEWMQTSVGEAAYRALWEPLLVGKFGPHYREVNMAWMWARFKARTTKLGTFEGGFQAFIDAFEERLRGMGVTFRLRTSVNGVAPRPEGGLTLSLEDGTVDVDHCLVTVSPALLARLAPSLAGDYLDQLLAMKSMGAVVMVLALKERLSKKRIYWHNLPKSAGFPFLSLVEHTNFVSREFFGGDHIVYCGDYLEPGHEYFMLSKSELLERFLPALTRINAKFTPDWVRDSWLFRTDYAQPVPPVHHSQAIPSMRTPIDGLWFASMSQVYPWDRGTNYAVKIAREAAHAILGEPTE